MCRVFVIFALLFLCGADVVSAQLFSGRFLGNRCRNSQNRMIWQCPVPSCNVPMCSCCEVILIPETITPPVQIQIPDGTPPIVVPEGSAQEKILRTNPSLEQCLNSCVYSKCKQDCEAYCFCRFMDLSNCKSHAQCAWLIPLYCGTHPQAQVLCPDISRCCDTTLNDCCALPGGCKFRPIRRVLSWLRCR